eukprot:3939941-Rhodomonas_salina.2
MDDGYSSAVYVDILGVAGVHSLLVVIPLLATANHCGVWRGDSVWADVAMALGWLLGLLAGVLLMFTGARVPQSARGLVVLGRLFLCMVVYGVVVRSMLLQVLPTGLWDSVLFVPVAIFSLGGMRAQGGGKSVFGSVALASVGWLFAVLVGALGEPASAASDARVLERRDACGDVWVLGAPLSFCVGLWGVLSIEGRGASRSAGAAAFWHAAVLCRCGVFAVLGTAAGLVSWRHMVTLLPSDALAPLHWHDCVFFTCVALACVADACVCSAGLWQCVEAHLGPHMSGGGVAERAGFATVFEYVGGQVMCMAMCALVFTSETTDLQYAVYVVACLAFFS